MVTAGTARYGVSAGNQVVTGALCRHAVRI